MMNFNIGLFCSLIGIAAAITPHFPNEADNFEFPDEYQRHRQEEIEAKEEKPKTGNEQGDQDEQIVDDLLNNLEHKLPINHRRTIVKGRAGYTNSPTTRRGYPKSSTTTTTTNSATENTTVT